MCWRGLLQVCLKTLINLSCSSGPSDVKVDELNDAALQARTATGGAVFRRYDGATGGGVTIVSCAFVCGLRYLAMIFCKDGAEVGPRWGVLARGGYKHLGVDRDS